MTAAPIPQGKIHLQLFWSLIADDLPNRRLLIGAQGTPVAKFPATRRRANGCKSACFIQINGFANRRIAESREINYPHHPMTFAMQTHDLLSPLMQLRQCLIPCVFFVHAAVNQKTRKCSNIIGPDQ
jgi:hypothetical protein